jgi:hypothetical protein
LTAHFPSTIVAPAIFVTAPPASDGPDLEICSAPMASVAATALARSVNSCLIVLAVAGRNAGMVGGGRGRATMGCGLDGPMPVAVEGPCTCALTARSNTTFTDSNDAWLIFVTMDRAKKSVLASKAAIGCPALLGERGRAFTVTGLFFKW